ncbi:hypothetical protein OG819_55295 [Streptomyces sp. NBC_01549]|uniref:hypothetical protein n=1 Tax=Streptomyces sp. NBC_01549 TaxID=2975874 RepID=UPI00224CF23E|nr:hypothetical protein [Streptomyces sp. NBC_01549]MCX4598325.1 hypothetical protein [Streptomyces sp. NBC_01549]
MGRPQPQQAVAAAEFVLPTCLVLGQPKRAFPRAGQADRPARTPFPTSFLAKERFLMPKQQSGPVFTLQPAAPAQPGRWLAHRHKVLAIAGLVIGFLIGQHADAPAATNTPPAHTTPAVSSTPSTP